jgi:ABC-type sugar transport system permease subunit
LADVKFWQAVRFTLLFVAIAVPSKVFLGFVMAMLLDQTSTRVRGVFIAIFLIPFIVVPIVGTLMFKQLFEPSGPMAWFFRTVLEERFIFTAASVKTLIILHNLWMATPFPMVVLFAGLQMLPVEHIEAALMDGANRWHQIRYIVIPHLGSLFTFIFLISIMDAFRIFDSVFVMTEQNPIFHAESVMLYNFRTAMSVQRLGKANAMSVLMVIMILVVLIPYLVRTYREQMEER